MLGVVVWSNEKRCKAVIWCEDQGALAYLEGMTSLLRAGSWPEAGDLVELESELEGGLRLARNVRLVSQGVGAALPQALRTQADAAPAKRSVVNRKSVRPRLVSNYDLAVADSRAVAATAKAVACN